MMTIRNVDVDGYFSISEVVDGWWGGRRVAHLLPRLFFEHFQDASYVIEVDGCLSAFLVGFISPSRQGEAYIHFVGVDPKHRMNSLARNLYETFFARAKELECTLVRSITSPENHQSIAFHRRMGFTDVVASSYAGKGIDRVLFTKDISSL